ncbi:glucan biosynthesis protein [Celerinatantimonas yamalensis]|uniref:Glucan biosynthesis protein G n=1 Tax=Celerinatantimonas yamalensis TaxID=559956 RepID=A0ABW9GBB4_9GAMM
MKNRQISLMTRMVKRSGYALVCACVYLTMASRAVYADDATNSDAPPQPYIQYTKNGPSDRNSVIELAKKLAQSPYQAPSEPLPKSLAGMSLAQYKSILFQPNQAVWAKDNLPFQMQLLMRGSYFDAPVEIATVDNGQANHLPFSPQLFTHSSGEPLTLPDQDIGFSGLSFYYRLNQPETYNKVIEFQGASYFKAIGKNEHWGASARGLAIDTADPKGEEIPVFRAFWVEKPSDSSNSIVVNALLDSPSVTGAYRFTIRPGDTTTMDVEVSLFPRKDLSKVGLAPMNSMYMFSTNDRQNFDDYRPEVHDSDGLLMVNGKGERLWRPLTNPKTLQMSAFVDEAPIGFGLMQRDRNFSDYQDLSEHFQDRPSLWVEPIGNWGKGSVSLIEIPSDSEIHDNIVAYWAPKSPLKAGSEYDYSYRLHWGQDPHPASNTYVISGTYAGRTAESKNSSHRHFVIDYRSPNASIPATASMPMVNVITSKGKITDVQVVKNAYTPGYRVSFNLDGEGISAAELRAELTFNDNRKAETWLYRWTSS